MVTKVGLTHDYGAKARATYLDRVLSFVDVAHLKPTRIVINSGNGAVGPTVDAFIERLERQDAPIEFICVHHEPDNTFPNGIPNPLFAKNHKVTADVVLREKADFGVAFDGDFDRFFL